MPAVAAPGPLRRASRGCSSSVRRKEATTSACGPFGLPGGGGRKTRTQDRFPPRPPGFPAGSQTCPPSFLPSSHESRRRCGLTWTGPAWMRTSFSSRSSSIKPGCRASQRKITTWSRLGNLPLRLMMRRKRKMMKMMRTARRIPKMTRTCRTWMR